ncbi:MAG: chaperone modulator CbpM [Methylococcaceae bacterium]|nr:chaperone modulator CbpM [Methylococcaceae bacterium]MDD1615032.1 chaperone modulator CbpM [Methylococcaceae bacterium]OYV21377.1 MAG: MerR family transcriptional regulator [Methylococcaceae bacterium NSP1-2]OYV21956.1 MAG: MerR family transcriptional regulator [Methylococcaceae bacterium NSP1-1]
MNSHDLLLIYTGTIIEDDSLTLGQLCRACGVNADWVISLVEEGIIEPEGKEIHCWHFSGANLVRVRSALRLQRDLGINLAGVGLVLDLMEELENLRMQLKITGDVT